MHKKSSRQVKTNYRPISLLPIFSKIFEKVLFDGLYSFLHSNNLLSDNQSGFRPGDSTINQLLSITHDIYVSFENQSETRAVFLDISKAFDKVWHEGLLHKLNCSGVDGNLLNLLSSFLSNRFQRVVLNGTHSDWLPLKSGVPQGSVLGPLLFLVYINDLTDNISSNIKLFADDSSLFTRVNGINITHSRLVRDLETIKKWAYQWKMQFNPDISKQAIEVIFSHKYKKPDHPSLSFNDVPVKRDDHTKHLGFFLDSHLNFRKHVEEKAKIANKGLGMLRFLSRYVDRRVLDHVYKMYIRPHLDYGDIIYHNQVKDSMDILEAIQYKAALIVSGCWKGTNRTKLYAELGWESLSDRRHIRRLMFYYRINANLTPSYLKNCVDHCPVATTLRFQNSFFPYCKNHWDLLSADFRSLPSFGMFRSKLIKSVRPPPSSNFGVTDIFGLKLLTQLRVDLNDLRVHRFRHGFRNCPSALCACGTADESTSHFFHQCPRFSSQRADLYSKIRSLDSGNSFFSLSLDDFTTSLLYGMKKLTASDNKHILESTIDFIRKSKRFSKLEAFA